MYVFAVFSLSTPHRQYLQIRNVVIRFRVRRRSRQIAHTLGPPIGLSLGSHGLYSTCTRKNPKSRALTLDVTLDLNWSVLNRLNIPDTAMPFGTCPLRPFGDLSFWAWSWATSHGPQMLVWAICPFLVRFAIKNKTSTYLFNHVYSFAVLLSRNYGEIPAANDVTCLCHKTQNHLRCLKQSLTLCLVNSARQIHKKKDLHS